MKKKFTFLIAAVMLLMMMSLPGKAVGQTRGTSTKTEGFEHATANSQYQSTAEVSAGDSDCGIAWSIYYGNVVNTSAVINDSQSCLMRYYTGTPSNLGYAKTTTGIDGLTNITFNAKVTNTGNKMGVWYSTDGSNWIAIATGVSLTLSSQSKSYNIPNSSATTTYYIKIGITAGTTNKKDLIIDDIVFTYTVPTQLSAPTMNTPVAGDQTATFSWSSVTDASSYTLEYTTTPANNNSWAVIANNISGTSYEKTGLDNDITYSARVKANGNGSTTSDSDYSNVETVTPTGGTLYTVTYDCNGGTSNCPDNVTGIDPEDNEITLADAPSKTGYAFGGWSDGNTTYNAGVQYTVTGNVTMTAQWTAYTVSAQSNNNTWGTVSVSGFTITASPADHYRVKSTEPYTLINGTATVTNNGDNTFTVTPTSDCKVQINFEALPTYTVTFHAGSGSCETESITELEGTPITLPTATPSDACSTYDWTFEGWSTTNVTTATQTKPNLEPTSYTVNGNVHLYAIYKREEEGGAPNAFSVGDTGDYAIVACNGNKYYALPTNPIVTSGKITGEEINVNEIDNVKYVTTANASGYTWTIASVGNSRYTISDGSNYIYHSNGGASGTNLTYGSSTDFTWAFEAADGCIKMKGATSNSINGRGMLFSSTNNNVFGGYSLDNWNASGYHKTMILPVGLGTSAYYATSPSCNTLYNVNIAGLQHGVIVATPSQAEEGEEVALTITPDNCYQLKSNTLVVNAGAVTVSNNTFTMPASNVTVSAEFEAVTYTVQYSVNGAVVAGLNENIDCGDDATLPTAGFNVPEGYTFKGWSDSESSNAVVSSYTPEADAILYAVLSITEEGSPVEVYQKVTEAPSDWSGDYLIVCETQGKVFNGTESNGYGRCNDVVVNDGAIEVIDAIDALVVTISAVTGGYQIEVGDAYMNWTDRDFSLAGEAETYSISLYDADVNKDNIKICYNNKWLQYNTSGGLRSYNSAQTPIQLYKKTTITPTIEHNYTLVKGVENGDEETIANIEATHLVMVKSGGVLTLTGANNGTAANLIVKDGGQLIVYATGAKDGEVQATVEKNIAAWNTGSTNGWYFISSPINDSDLKPNTVVNMLPDDEVVQGETVHTYDLYSYDATNMVDEVSKAWVNYRAHSEDFTIENGMGYLYARKEGATLEFAGAIKPYDADNTIPVSEGWNLIGNPYTFNAYPNTAYYTINDANDGITAETGMTSGEAVAPCTGIIIMAEDSGNVKFLEEAPSGSINNGNVRITLAQNVVTRGESKSQTIDNAIVSFNEGNQLGKFYFGTQDANLYIPMDNEEYAIVSSSTQGEMPINFKAHRDGQYTLTVNPEEVEMGYLHLIDNIAGKEVDLLANPSYTFNAKADDYESRFRLVFSANMVNTDLDDDFAFFSNGQLVIANEGESLLQVIDVNGRIVATESVNGTCSKAINVKAGVYVLRLINGENVKTQKIIVK